MTLTEILPAVRQLAAIDKIKLIRILAEELDADKDISPLKRHKVYYLPTPYNTFGAGQALANALGLAKTAADNNALQILDLRPVAK